MLIHIYLDETIGYHRQIKLKRKRKGRGKKSMMLVLRCTRLFPQTKKATYVASDPSHKLNWINFPILFCSTTDKAKAFHPFGILLSRTQTQEEFEFI
ncbi:hypothetical protein BpHYR1_044167 [Brachionus plicatilis]|uniref:MULE transposase domain-containing protein n=1 Tax=Brachionus plicatilis TaxID=10195 RepID=A0A3M7T1M3_BRAPC|nr:hypothetical protein BpHYR1_044167 [Brachionus plicatilis]